MRSNNALRLVRRAAVVCLATAGVAAFGGQTANATTGSVSGQVSAPQPASASASAAVIRTYGFACGGARVRRCAWFNVDHTNNRARAYSYIVDVNGGRNYSVATSHVRLQVWTGRAWANVAGSFGNDFDGWHAVADGAHGGLARCTNGRVYLLRSVALFQWRGNPNGAEWRSSAGVRVRC